MVSCFLTYPTPTQKMLWVMKMATYKDIRGEKFGLLTPISYLTGGFWLCKCDCGNECEVRSNKLRSGNTKSCGCYRKTFITERNTKHNETTHYLHRLWSGMKSRCYNPNTKRWSRYGGRGIVVCDEWKDDYITFRDYILEHLGERPEGHSLDRINNNGNYEPNNVRWATSEIQNNNRDFGTGKSP